MYENNGEQVIIGPQLPTHFVTPSMTLRVPGNVTISARGEYRGGNMMEVNPISIGRSVRSPLCAPVLRRSGELDRAQGRASRTSGASAARRPVRATTGSTRPTSSCARVSATIPVDFAFPDRVSGATLTLALNNAWAWYKEIPWYDTEIAGNGSTTSGLDESLGNATERMPAPATFRISLRVTF